MGKVKDYAMDQEDRFWEIVYQSVDGYNNYYEFENDMMGHGDLLMITDLDTLETTKMMLREIYESDKTLNGWGTHGNA